MKTILVISCLLILISVQISYVGAILSSQTNWSDDFNDGTYDDWTVTRGAFDASDGVLRGTTDTWNWIYRESTINTGVWSFDVYYAGFDGFNVWFMCNYIQSGNYYRPWDGYFIHISEYTGGTIQLKRDWDGGQVVLASYNPPESLDGWWNLEVNRSSDGWISVQVNGTNVMEVQDDKWDASLYFFYESYNLQAIDNINAIMNDAWADDFDDGNYDGWTVTRGGYSASSNALRGTTSTWNYIEHPSTAATGTWSFDYDFYGGADGIWQPEDGDLAIWFIANDHHHTTQAQSGYFLYFHPHDDAMELWMDPGDEGYNRVLLGSWSPPDFVKLWHVEITRDTDCLFTVYLDGINRIQATDTTYNTSVYFGFLGYNQQEMDNVRVNMPESTTSPTTDTTPSTTDSTTPTNGSGQGIIQYLLSNPVVLAAIVVVLVALIAAFLRRPRY